MLSALPGAVGAGASVAAPALAWVPLPRFGAEFLPSVVAGGVFLALAAALLALDFPRRLSRAFALFLVLRGILNLLGPFRQDPATAAFWTHLYPYLAISIPVAALHFALVHRHAGGPRGVHRGLSWALLGLGAAAAALYAADHAHWAWLSAPFRGPEGGRVAAYLGVAAVFAWDHLRARPGPGRASLLLIAVSFALYPLAYVPARPLLYGEDAALELALCAGVLALVAAAASGGDAGRRRASRAALACLLATAAFPLANLAARGALATTGPGPEFPTAQFVAEGVTTLAQPVLVTYALLRHRLFGIELTAKRGLQRGALAAGFVAAFLAVDAAAQPLQPRLVATLLQLSVVGGFLLFLRPLRAGAARLADAAFPGVAATPEYLSLRKVEMYRAALDQAAAAGALADPAEQERLAGLRRRLGLSDRDHALLAVGAGRGAAAPALEHLAPGHRVLRRYTVVELLGEGAHGRTYLARDGERGDLVAVKVVRPDRGGDAVAREARAIAAVQHPRVVGLREVRHEGGATLLVMEHVAGGSLRARVALGPLPAAAFRQVAMDLLEALGAVHGAGIVHRDVKPSNVLLTPEGRAKLADFGIAHLPGLETTVGGPDGGAAIGTIPYMSPEQAKGRRVTVRSDLFSAAATLYEAHTGKPYLAPRPHESPIELQMRAAAAGPFRAPVETPALRAWFSRVLAPDPADRFASAAEMRAALAEAWRAPGG